MTGSEHSSLLRDTERTEGGSALARNVAVANELAGTVRSTLGPRGLDKMLVDGEMSGVVTNDGATILTTAQIEHPTAKMLVSLAQGQEKTASDGTTTTILLMSELLHNGLELTDRGVHPSVICRGFQKALEFAQTEVEKIARPLADEWQHLQAVRTSLAGKSDEGMREHLAALAVEAANSLTTEVGYSPSANKEHVKVIHDRAGVGVETTLFKGLVLPKERIHPEMELRPKGGKILLLDGGIERRKPEMEINFKATKTGMISQLEEREKADVEERVKAVSDSGAKIIIVRDGIDDDARSMLNKAGILAYRRVERPELEFLARITGSSLVHNVKSVNSADLGKCSSISEENWHGVNHAIILGSHNGGLTLVVRGSSQARREEIERSFDDALGIACNLVSNPLILPGGGATQMAISRRLRKHARTVSGREQLAIEAFAAALEAIPRILAENAGLSPLDEVIRLRAAQEEARKHGDWIGLDLFAGQPERMDEANIIEPLQVTKNSLSSATEAAISVLRIDDMLWSADDSADDSFDFEN